MWPSLMFFKCCFALPTLIIFTVCCFFYYKYKSKRSRFSNLSWKDKHIIITGGSSGIGKSLAKLAVGKGANVTLVARNIERLEDARSQLMELRANSVQKIKCLPLDISGSYDVIADGVRDAETELGPCYMLINCAGSALCGTLEDCSPDDIKKNFDLNTLGSILVTKAVLPGMKSRQSGYLVFVSSMAAFLGVYGLAAYSASKYALRGFAEAIQMEVKPYRIQVTISFPPDTDTPGFAEEEKTKPKETRLISNTAGLASPDDVAKDILMDVMDGAFLSSNGVDGFLLTTLNAGMTPVTSFIQLILQMVLMGPFRIVGTFYLYSFDAIVRSCQKEKQTKQE